MLDCASSRGALRVVARRRRSGRARALRVSRGRVLTWTTPAYAALSFCWVFQFAHFGVRKSITSIQTGNAWIHIINTHVPHLTEAEAVGQVLGLG